MPLPWKKLRISQLVADLHSPAKRRGSMVVETGFPTSLVDLFVKNRDRLRKASKSKHSHRSKHGHRRGIGSSDIPSTKSPPNEVPARDPPQTVALSSSTEVAVGLERPIRGKSGGVEAVDVDGGGYCDGINIEPIRCVDGGKSFANRFFAAVLKIFVVVALALSTKKLVVGITLSAFALLLLEYLGKHMDVELGAFLKPCSDARERLIRWGLPLFWQEKASRKLEKCKSPKRLVLQESAMVCDSLDEIESVGDSNFEEENRGREEGAGLGCVTVEREPNCVDMRTVLEGNEDRGEEVRLYGKNQSRSGRIKAKIIRKCVPKKLRDLRKKKKSKGIGSEEDGSERSSYMSIEDSAEDKPGGESKDDDDEDESLICELPREGGEELGRGREGNSGYQMLILIVLVGLVGGRIWAFALTFLWCLALKCLGNARALQNVPMMRSLVSIRRWHFG